MSAEYFPPADFEAIEGAACLSLYQFGDAHVEHYFCKRCGVHPFFVVAGVPVTYDGPAKPGYYRVNLGCVAELDVSALDIDVIDGRSF
jgi:hypothetical protein